jgi:hypothetical protein
MQMREQGTPDRGDRPLAPQKFENRPGAPAKFFNGLGRSQTILFSVDPLRMLLIFLLSSTNQYLMEDHHEKWTHPQGDFLSL